MKINYIKSKELGRNRLFEISITLQRGFPFSSKSIEAIGYNSWSSIYDYAPKAEWVFEDIELTSKEKDTLSRLISVYCVKERFKYG